VGNRFAGKKVRVNEEVGIIPGARGPLPATTGQRGLKEVKDVFPKGQLVV